MLNFLPPLVAELRGDISGFAVKMGEAVAIAKSETSAMGGAFNTLATVGKAAVLGLGAAAVAGAAASLKLGADFEAATTMLHTQAGMTIDDMKAVRQGLLNMAPAVGIGPTALAEGFYHVASAATQFAPELQNVNSELDIFQNAVKLSKIGNADLEASTQAVIGSVAAFGREGLTAAQAAAQLNAIVGAGDMRMQQLTSAMATGVLPAAATFGLKLTDVGAALATLTDNVTPADEAATRLRMTFSLLGAPSGVAQRALAALGINATQLGYDLRKPDGLLVAVGDLRSHLSHIDVSGIQGGLGTVKSEMEKFGFTTDQVNKIVKTLGPDATEQAFLISKAFGGGRSSAAIMTLLSEFDSFKEKYKVINAGASQFGEAWEQQQSTFHARMDRMRASVETLGVSIGMRLIPYVERAMDSVGKFSDFLARNQQISVPLAAAIGGVLVAAIIAYTIAMAAAAVATIAASFPIILITVGIAALVVGLVLLITHWQQVVNWVQQVGEKHWWLQAILAVFLSPLILLIWHWGQVVNVVQTVITWFGHAGDAFSALGTFVRNLTNDIGGMVDALGHANDAARNVPFIGGVISHFEGRQGGGPVLPGRAYTVGERGPETLFMGGGGGGYVVPGAGGGSGGGGSPTIVNIYVSSPADAHQIGNEVVWALKYM